MTTFVQGHPVRRLPELTDQVRRGTPRRITEYGEPILHRPCQEITEFGTDRWSALIDDMFTTMWIAEGCGLAANQVDVDARLFVYDLTTPNGDRHLGHILNPTAESLAPYYGDQTDTEGCLSIPGARAPLPRPARITLHGYDLQGAPLTIQADGYLARCLLHETQHLQGLLYTDHLPQPSQTRTLAASKTHRPDVITRRTARQRQLGK